MGKCKHESVIFTMLTFNYNVTNSRKCKTFHLYYGNMVIACLILDRNYDSPRTGQFSRMQTKLTEHIKISLRTISIKFLLVIKMLYKTKNGRQQVSNTVPSALYRMYGNNRTWCIISIVTENKPHAHHETHLHTMKVVTILIHSFYGHC